MLDVRLMAPDAFGGDDCSLLSVEREGRNDLDERDGLQLISRHGSIPQFLLGSEDWLCRHNGHRGRGRRFDHARLARSIRTSPYSQKEVAGSSPASIHTPSKIPRWCRRRLQTP